VTADELAARIRAGTAPRIVDVRSKMEYAHAHIPGAVHVPFWAVPARGAGPEADPEQALVVYCGHGPRARMAAAALRRKGFRHVELLHGHWNAWKKAPK
jgi:rhodanese-related sulfurtransferase